ncbi:MAG TPA: DUF1499 domain-containing protein [Gemmatimonadaceae bacterium]|jgi:membrane protein YqaA with SNARE-associated domain|nr:DUF1499 domain-containing protein [Gemmatimonadaceae bacterium]
MPPRRRWTALAVEAALGFFLDSTAIAAGAAAGYWLAHAIGEPATRHLLHRRHGWLNHIGETNRFGTLPGLQLSPLVPNGVLNLAAGLAGIDFKLYMASVLVGNSTPGSAIADILHAMPDRRTTTTPPPSRGLPLIVAVAVLVVALGVLAELASRFGYRGGFWPLPTALSLFRIGAWTALLGALLGVPAALATRPGTHRRGFVAAILAILIGLAAAGSAAYWRITTHRAPPIHDISTDPADPPAFVALHAARVNAPNGSDYGGPDVAAQQRAAYPDIVPAIVVSPPPVTFARALAIARDMRWSVVAADTTAGRIEATTTSWFGFTDDIVVRITPVPEGTRVDIRSASRAADTDGGTNAHHIRTYLHELTSN